MKIGSHPWIIFIAVLLMLAACTSPTMKEKGRGDDLSDLYNKSNERIETGFDSTQLSTSSKMLAEEVYWDIITRSIKASTSLEDQEKWLVSELGKLSPEEIIGFKLRTDKLLIDSYNSDLWCAGYLMNGGCSDDCFEYFRCWIISRGKESYYNSKTNPDYLVNEVNTGLFEFGIKVYEFEGLLYVAGTAFNQKTGKEIYDYLGNSKVSDGAYTPLKFNWNEDKPESMKQICPKLYKEFEE